MLLIKCSGNYAMPSSWGMTGTSETRGPQGGVKHKATPTCDVPQQWNSSGAPVHFINTQAPREIGTRRPVSNTKHESDITIQDLC
jgi:hypothetical protein